MSEEIVDSTASADTPEPTVRVIGLDIGTGYISSVEKAKTPGKVKLRKVRDAFLRVDPDEFMDGNAPQFGEKMMKKTGTHYIKMDGILYILGDSAYEMAIESNKELLRPMSKGVLNPLEPISALMVEQLVKAIVGDPKDPQTDVVFYCVPADPIDADYDVEYHKATVREAIENIGYKNIQVMHEGLSVIYSELFEDNFTGVAISCGSGMINVSYANKGMEILNFSLAKGGDYIDQSAAKQVNDNISILTYRKEDGMSILDPQDEYERAISVYYKNLIQYSIKSFTHLYKQRKKNPDPTKRPPMIIKPVPLVVSGGTSLVGGFIEVFNDLLKQEKDFPIKISEVRQAEEPLYAVANGLYQAAKLNSELG